MNPFLLLLGLTAASGLGSLKKESGITGSKSREEDILPEEPIVEEEITPTAEDTLTGGDDTVARSEDTMTGGEDTMTGGHDTMTGGDDTMTDTMTGGDDTMTGGHEDHTDPALMPPGIDATPMEIAAYLDALFALEEVHVHDAGNPVLPEHSAALNLVPRDASTHVAIGDGNWFDPSIWANGEVPGDGARVLIPEGVTVDYAGVSDARIFTLRVDGTLDFDPNTDSQLIFDTFVVSPTGHLIIGTEADPVDPNVDIDLIVANNGPIDTDWDPMLLSRGLISHGETTIHGAIKDSHEKVDTDPMQGDTSISFAEVPEGWQVGDTIVIAGTHYDGYKWDNEIGGQRHYESEDEVRVITKIDEDGTVHFEEPLIHDHDAPREDLKTSVANYTRNVSIETENAEEAEVFERGHVMFMHSDNVDVRYMEFHELGRTDKSEPSQDVSDFESTSFDSNVQGRYSLHLHRTGTADQDDPAILEGNAVYGSPGWGIVHHDSHAELTNNATFDTFGAGYVAETGNETGAWTDNIAIFAQGIHWGIPKNTTTIDDDTFDTGRGGDGFWFQGRLVASSDNIAASVNTGFVYFHRDGDDRMIDFDSSLFDYPDALYGDENVHPDDTPILFFQGNETFASKEGLHIVKANPNQGHDVWSQLDDFTAWSVKSGAHLEYTSHYILTNFDVVGKEPTEFSTAGSGISIGNNTSEIVIIDANVTGFETGIDLFKEFVNTTLTEDQHNYIVIDPTFQDVTQFYANYDPALDQLLSREDLPGSTPDLALDGPLFYKEGYPDPEARMVKIEGVKTDSLGDVEFPGGTDSFNMYRDEVISHLEKDGYWTTSEGQAYFLLDIYFTDRLTGEIYYETHPVYIDPNVPLGSAGALVGRYEFTKSNGTQDIIEQDGVLYAGDTPLDIAIPAEPVSSAAASADDGMDMTGMTSADAVIDMSWLDGQTDTLEEEDDLFAPEEEPLPETEDAFLSTSDSSGTLAVFACAAGVDIDGNPCTALEEPVIEDAIATEDMTTEAEEDALWLALTADQGFAEDAEIPVDDTEEEIDALAA